MEFICPQTHIKVSFAHLLFLFHVITIELLEVGANHEHYPVIPGCSSGLFDVQQQYLPDNLMVSLES